MVGDQRPTSNQLHLCKMVIIEEMELVAYGFFTYVTLFHQHSMSFMVPASLSAQHTRPHPSV